MSMSSSDSKIRTDYVQIKPGIFKRRQAGQTDSGILPVLEDSQPGVPSENPNPEVFGKICHAILTAEVKTSSPTRSAGQIQTRIVYEWDGRKTLGYIAEFPGAVERTLQPENEEPNPVEPWKFLEEAFRLQKVYPAILEEKLKAKFLSSSEFKETKSVLNELCKKVLLSMQSVVKTEVTLKSGLDVKKNHAKAGIKNALVAAIRAGLSDDEIDMTIDDALNSLRGE